MRYLFLIILFLTACTSSEDQVNNESVQHELEIIYARHFTITEIADSLIIRIMSPKDGHLEKELTVAKQKSVPSLITLSSTHIGMLSKLGLTNHIVGVSNINYVANETVLERYNLAEVVEVGEESNLPLEHIVKVHPNYIIYSGFGKVFPYEKRFEQLGINCVQNYDWEEIHPLGKAEWIKVIGAICGKYNEACDYFKSVEKEYNQLKSISNQKKSAKSILSGNTWGDTWHCPAGESYNAHLFRDAGLEYLYSNTKGTGSLSFTLEQILVDNRSADIWINPGATSLAQLKSKNPKAIHFDAFKNKQVYCYSPKANIFWENSAIEPHRVLKDLIQINNGGQLTDSLYFYSRLE